MRSTNINRRRSEAFSLIEILCVISIIGVLAAVAVPFIQGLDRASVTKSKRNAQMTVELSSNLSTLGFAHVLPESLGGAAATTRLLQSGVVILEGEMEGAHMGMQNLPVDEIDDTAAFIKIVHDDSGPRLEYDSRD